MSPSTAFCMVFWQTAAGIDMESGSALAGNGGAKVSLSVLILVCRASYRLCRRDGVGVPEVPVLVEVRVQKSGLDHVGDGRASIDFHAELVASGVLEEPTRLGEGLAYDVSAEDASKDRQDSHRPNGCGVTCLLLQREKHALAEVADDR